MSTVWSADAQQRILAVSGQQGGIDGHQILARPVECDDDDDCHDGGCGEDVEEEDCMCWTPPRGNGPSICATECSDGGECPEGVDGLPLQCNPMNVCTPPPPPMDD